MERRHLETAAAKYSCLRGLLALPGGALFILGALGNWKVGPFRHAWAFLAAVVVLGAVWLALSRYYTDNYGRLNPSPRQQARLGVALAVAVALMIGGSLLLRSRAAWSLDLPVNAIAVSFALVMLITYAVSVGLRPYHVVIWGGVLVAGALPVWDGPDPSNVGLVLAGLGMMVTGLFDHRAFVQTFGAPGALRLEDGDVGV
jgi:hypothetical protein